MIVHTAFLVMLMVYTSLKQDLIFLMVLVLHLLRLVIHVADFYNHRIQKSDSNGNFITKWGSEGPAE
jgi:hypothetical protein